MDKKYIKRYRILGEGAKAKKNIVDYEYTSSQYCVELEFNTYNEAKVEFEENYKYNEVNEVFGGWELTIFSINEDIILIDKNGDEVHIDSNTIEISKFEFEDEEDYAKLKEFVKSENLETYLLSYDKFDQDYSFLNMTEKENLIYIYEKLTKNNLLNFIYDIVEELNSDLSDYTSEKETRNKINELIKNIKENGELL